MINIIVVVIVMIIITIIINYLPLRNCQQSHTHALRKHVTRHTSHVTRH